MGNEARQHHYIPQCYLRGFLPANQKKPNLTVLDLQERRSYLANTRNVGGVRDFNRIEVENIPHDGLESGLSGFETMAADALRSVSEKRSLADRHALLVIVNLIALFHLHGRFGRAFSPAILRSSALPLCVPATLHEDAFRKRRRS